MKLRHHLLNLSRVTQSREGGRNGSSNKGCAQRTYIYACCDIVSTWPSLTTSQPATRALSLLRTIQFAHPPSCPCHSNPGHHHHSRGPAITPYIRGSPPGSRRSYATPQDPSQLKEYAFEMAASSIRFGNGVTQEVGMDFKNMGAQLVCVVTDETVDKLRAMKQVREALDRENIKFHVFNKTRVEPKDSS